MPTSHTAPFAAGVSAARRVARSRRIVVSGAVMSAVFIACIATMPWTLRDDGPLGFDAQASDRSYLPPGPGGLFGTDILGRSLLGRCLLGGAISLAIGAGAAAISTMLGVGVGLLAGYRGGWVDAMLMRFVDILYGLPYILLILLFTVAFQDRLAAALNPRAANLIVLFLAIGSVSWLTMARVVRGQVLSLRAQPFIEAARAAGLTETRIFFRHLLPNLVGPITVYATLIVPQAILQESFLSFLGVGVQDPLPTWGKLASDGLLPALNPINSRWWLLLFPSLLLAVTLLCLNFAGDGLRDVFDPRRESAKI